MKKLAKLLSFLLGPFVWPITLVILILKTGLTRSQIAILLPSCLFLQIIIPYAYILFAYKKKRISDLDITIRSERYRAMILTFFSFLISLWLVFIVGNRLLFNLFLLVLILIIINTSITFFWKISLHMAINVASAILINFLFQYRLPFLYLSLPVVYWARLQLKKHSPLQLLAALVINTVVILFSLRFIHSF